VSAGPSHQIDTAVRLIAETGVDILTMRDVLTSGGSEKQAGGSRFGYARRIPLADIAPGRYLLRIEARTRRENPDAVAAETSLTVTN